MPYSSARIWLYEEWLVTDVAAEDTHTKTVRFYRIVTENWDFINVQRVTRAGPVSE